MSSSAELEQGFNDTVGVLNSQNAALVDHVADLLTDERLWAVGWRWHDVDVALGCLAGGDVAGHCFGDRGDC
jgi:hypothetical protein